MRLFFLVCLVLSFASLPSKAEGIFGDLENMLGDALEEMNKEMKKMQENDNSGNFNSDGSINFEQAFENAANQEVEWSPYTRKSVNAPMRCPNWYSADMMERQEARERYTQGYNSGEMMWWNDCGEFYPDAKKPYIDPVEQCKMMGPELCAKRDQLQKFNKIRNDAILDYSLSLVKIAEAIGLKENAAGLRATIEFLKSEGLEGTTEYEDRFDIAFTEAKILAQDIGNKIQEGYIPTESEIVLLQQAIKLKNEAALKWINAVKEREKLKKMDGALGFLVSLGGDDFAFKGLAEDVEIQLSAYEKTVSQNTGKNLGNDDANLDKALDEVEF